MLALLVGLLVSAGPLLRGSWDPWAESLFFCVVALGTGLWLAGKILIGYVPLPSRRTSLWAGGLAAAALASALLSPVGAYAVPSWRAVALGLWIFPAVTVISKDERALIDEAARAAAWVLALLAFYQRVHDHIARPPSALLNENVFAAAILLLLPLAASKRDWLLSSALLICLWWCRSVGAWLGLAASLILLRRRSGLAGYWAGIVIGACALVAVGGKFRSPQVADRWGWWMAAGRMIASRPWLGFGPGTIGFVLPGFQTESWGISTIYAHQHLLETAAECGVPFLAAWLAGLASFLRRGGAYKRFGAAAVLIQSMWDYGLSIPAIYWLFCYFAASSATEQARGLNVPARAKPSLCAAVLVAAAAAGGWSWRLWRADVLRAQAAELLLAGDSGERAAALLARSAEIADDPEGERLAAEAELRRSGPTREGVLRAARHYYRSARLDPYRASNWSALAAAAARLGDRKSAERFLAEGARYCPSMRPNYGASP